MSLAMASRYARALADILFDGKSELTPEAAIGQLRSFEAALAESVDLRSVLLSPAVPVGRKRAIIGRLADHLQVAKVIRNFLSVIVERRRTQILTDIRGALEAEIDSRKGVVRADVVSARELDESQRGLLNANLSRLTGKQVRSEFSVNPELLGGATARIGSTVYDGSVRGQLQAIRRRLADER